MEKEQVLRRVSRLLASILLLAVAFFSIYEAVVPGRAILSAGYVNSSSGSGLLGAPVPGSGTPDNNAMPAANIRGSLIDEDGLPVGRLAVELIPSGKTEDEEWRGRQFTMSDKSGEYEFKNILPGEYFVGVHIKDAPDGEHPFETSFYPGVRTEADAQKIYLGENDHISLQWMRLHRTETVTIPVSLRWQDGEKVERGNLLFGNLSYPNSAPVGGYAPQIDNGEGTIQLPLGFEYRARAKVDCDAGTKIQTIESRPIQTFLVNENERPERLVFVIPASRCELWKPSP